METVQIPVRADVFNRLKLLAEPLVDDANSVIEKLLRHWETAPPTLKEKIVDLPKPTPEVWRSSRGESFPVGAKLRATYLRHVFEATITNSGIEFEGQSYDSPSAAGIAAKESIGTPSSAARTNGWSFWEMLLPNSTRWVSIDTLRSKNGA